jgi:hypothetical protein
VTAIKTASKTTSEIQPFSAGRNGDLSEFPGFRSCQPIGCPSLRIISHLSWPLIRVRLFHVRASFPAEFFVSRIGGHSCDELAADLHREIDDPAIASNL